MKAAIYLRVSRDDLNLENQLGPCVAYCKRQGWEYEVFQEKESTRKTRPVQYKLFHKGLRKEVGAIVVFRFDRWARNAVELISHMNDFTVKGVKFISISEAIDPSTSYGQAFFGFIAVMAEFERNIIRERTLAGLDRARRQGKRLGRPPTERKVKELEQEIERLKTGGVKKGYL